MLRRLRLLFSAALLAVPAAGFANPSAFDKTIAGPGPADDTAPSMGVFRVVVEAPYRPWFLANIPVGPFWDGISRLTSPVLYDLNTKIGRSAAHQQGSPPDVLGTPVGTAGTIVKDSDMIFPPGAGFNSPNPLRYEVHTEVRSFDLQPHDCGIATVCNGNSLTLSVRAGTGLGLQLCPGEIESNSNDGFPAKSFFDVFVEVDIGGANGFGIVKNDAFDPLLVVHDPITDFPPKVVYIHENPAAVPVYFKNSGVTGSPPFIPYTAGQRFGYLVLAGHAENLTCQDSSLNCAQFWNQTTNRPEMPLPDPTATLLSLFQAAPVGGGLELRWQFGNPASFTSVDLERAGSDAGPWSLVTAERRSEGGVSITVDRDVVNGQTYDYRLAATATNGERTIFGPLRITAGQANASFALGRVIPNPTQGRAKFDYVVGRESRVRLSIVDVQGRTLTVLANGIQPAGKYQGVWDGRVGNRLAPPGLYFVRYETPAKIMIQRMAITR